MSREFSIAPYDDTRKSAWQECRLRVRQQSFLFSRDFMDYHRDRFPDASLMALDAKGTPVALLPACRNPKDGAEVTSHAGLTYGGLLTTEQATAVWTARVLDACMARYAQAGYERMVYKPTPHIYHACPSEEDLYWLFRRDARLQARAVSSVVPLGQPCALSTLRRRKVRKAAGLRLETQGGNLEEYWQLLTAVLQTRHATRPVHSLAEMRLLMGRFGTEIRLYAARSEADGEMLAGCLLFVTPGVVHVQYIAASDRGCRACALDWLFARIIERAGEDFPGRRHLDFGISTEEGGRLLNEGLIFQKEGFGARAVCYDTYVLDLRPFR